MLCRDPMEHVVTVGGKDGHYEQATIRLDRECIYHPHSLQRVESGRSNRLHSDQGRCRLDRTEIIDIKRLRIENERYPRDERCGLLEQLQPLATDRIDRTGEPGRIALGARNVL